MSMRLQDFNQKLALLVNKARAGGLSNTTIGTAMTTMATTTSGATVLHDRTIEKQPETILNTPPI